MIPPDPPAVAPIDTSPEAVTLMIAALRFHGMREAADLLVALSAQLTEAQQEEADDGPTRWSRSLHWGRCTGRWSYAASPADVDACWH
jgi:hypothetical protein